MKDDGKESRRRGDHEWNLRDRIAAKGIDIQHCGAEAGWETSYIEHVVLRLDCTLKGTRAHLRIP